MSNRAKFTDQLVRNLKPDPGGRRVTHWDSATTGFGLRISPKGVKSFFFWFRPPGAPKAEKRRLTLGKYPQTSLVQARDLARKAHVQALAGQDPVVEKRKRVEEARRERSEALTFGEFADRYIKEFVERTGGEQELAPHTQVVIKGLIRNHLTGRWGGLRLRSITRTDVKDLLQEIEKAIRNSPRSRNGGRTQVNRIAVRLHHMFNWAIDEDLLETNPVKRLEKRKEPSRERVLGGEKGDDTDEIRRFWSALSETGSVAAGVFKAMLLTGQRGGEIKQMRWEDINRGAEDGWIWTIPAQVAKNRRPHRVPLTAEVQRLLVELSQARADDIYVFPGLPGRPITHTNRAFRRACRIAEVEDFRPHDLRHTAATGITELGFPRFIAGQVLGHHAKSMTETYDHHDYEKQKREALTAWAQKLTRILAGPRVVRLHEEVAS